MPQAKYPTLSSQIAMAVSCGAPLARAGWLQSEKRPFIPQLAITRNGRMSSNEKHTSLFPEHDSWAIDGVVQNLILSPSAQATLDVEDSLTIFILVHSYFRNRVIGFTLGQHRPIVVLYDQSQKMPGERSFCPATSDFDASYTIGRISGQISMTAPHSATQHCSLMRPRVRKSPRHEP